MQETEWIPIDGTLSSGKTSVIEELKRMGFRTVKEAARTIIDEGLARGLAMDEIRRSEIEFNLAILARKIKTEKELPPGERIFLDRGIPSSIGYLRVHGDKSRAAIEASFTRRYKKVFIADPLPMALDEARKKDFMLVEQFHTEILRGYREVDYDPIIIPVFEGTKEEGVRQRVQFILERL